MKQKTCEMILWIGADVGEAVCGQPAVKICDKGKKYQAYMCVDCAAKAHPTRLTKIKEATE